MCGITGVALKEGNATELVYQGLERLEYRGYDSAGLAILNDDKISLYKKSGRVSALKDGLNNLTGSIGIGHTRWATHGQPSERNAHPHMCGKFALAHNGIIENFAELKEELISFGESFLSDTDTEVIVKLINAYYKGNALKAVACAVKRLKGSFALAVLCQDFKGIIAVKYKSPVIVGFGKEGVCLSSDVPALPLNVSSAIIPEDGDIVVITPDSAEVYDFELKRIERVRTAISPVQLLSGKGDYPHYMLKEIYEAERTIADTTDGFLRRADLKSLKALLCGADRIIITGCGTAYNAGLAGVKFFAGKIMAFCTAELAGELRYELPEATPKTVALAVSQSGETADTVEASCALKQRGAKVVAITNCGYSEITRIADLVIPVCAGPEICVCATKSYIGQLCTLYLLSRIDSLNCSAKALLEVKNKIGCALNEDKAKEFANLCAQSSAVFFLGRGIDYVTAVEASLKLKEVSYVFSDAYPAGELKHGTLALIDEGTLSVFIICGLELAQKSINAVEQVVSRKGKVAVITCIEQVAKSLEGKAKVWLLPPCEGIFSPFLASVALQLTAYYTAVALGRDPDKPRNLAKSVTVE
ncbi:MAG: glutamine--fructose-6-phosphate transaminase (isomerizing) [Candidatus Coproplasma sp.]